MQRCSSQPQSSASPLAALPAGAARIRAWRQSMPPSSRAGRRRRPSGRRGSSRTRRRRHAASTATLHPRRWPMPSWRARRPRSSIRADGKLMGDWKKGEVLAQSGYGGRFTDYPPRAGERRQLLRLPPARCQGAELRHAGAEPCRVRQEPQVRRGRGEGRLRADLQPAGRHPVREHAASGGQQVPHRGTDQGPGGFRDVTGKPG